MKIKLSPLASEKLELLLDYLESNWSENTRNSFLYKLQQSFNKEATHPRSSIESAEFPNLFECIVNKQNSF